MKYIIKTTWNIFIVGCGLATAAWAIADLVRDHNERRNHDDTWTRAEKEYLDGAGARSE